MSQVQLGGGVGLFVGVFELGEFAFDVFAFGGRAMVVELEGVDICWGIELSVFFFFATVHRSP